jgi:hypothetical protein
VSNYASQTTWTSNCSKVPGPTSWYVFKFVTPTYPK